MCTENNPCHNLNCATFRIIETRAKSIRAYPTRQSGDFVDAMNTLIKEGHLIVEANKVKPNLNKP